MRVSSQLSWIQRVGSRFLARSHVTHVVSILLVFVPLRVFVSLRGGIVPSGDGVVVTGVELGRVWLGETTLGQLFSDGGVPTVFLRERMTQLFYPLLISLQGPIGWSIETHLFVLNTALGVCLIVGSYYTALRLGNKAYAFLAAFLMCSLTPLYWIARFGIVDNLFYAMIPLFGLSVINWYQKKTRRSLTLMLFGFIAFAFTRPEALLAVLAVTSVLAWDFLRRYWSRRVLLGGAFLALGTVCAAAILVLNSAPVLMLPVTFQDRDDAAIVINASDFDPAIHVRATSPTDTKLPKTLPICQTSETDRCGVPPSFQGALLSTMHISLGLMTSSQTFLNPPAPWPTGELDRQQERYNAKSLALTGDELDYLISIDSLEVIRSNPLWYLLKIPIRSLALLFPWTYQPWSLPHVLYEAVYTIFIAIGIVLLMRRGNFQMPLLVLLAICLSIWFFVSVYGIDNDLRYRNGMLVGLNLIAPLGYFLASHPPRIDPKSDPEQ